MGKAQPQTLEIAKRLTGEQEEQLESGEVVMLTEAQAAELIARFESEESEEEPMVIDADFESLSSEAQSEITRLEGEYNLALREADQEAAKSRLDLLKAYASRLMEFGKENVPKAAKATLEFLDLDTKEKAMEALLEVIPYVGAVYAVTGKRIKIQKGADGIPKPTLEDISWTDRGIYLAGELIVSGHVARGIKDAFLKKGAKAVAVEIGKAAAARGGEVLVKRAKKGAEKIVDQAVEEIKDSKKAS